MGIVCLVLFDARGSHTAQYDGAALCLALAMLLAQYAPALHRPQLVEGLCEDLLHIATHAAAACAITTPVLRYACALHCTCFLLQHRLRPSVFVHTVTAMWLAAAWAYGPRITDLRPFIIAVAFPHVVDVVARAVVHLQKLIVLWITSS